MKVIDILRQAMDIVGIQGSQRAELVGHFYRICGETLKTPENPTTAEPQILVVNEAGNELAIQRRKDGKWEFCPTAFEEGNLDKSLRPHIKENTERDGCKLCLGAKGGVPGNENVIGGVVVCDYCTSTLMDMKKAGWFGQSDKSE